MFQKFQPRLAPEGKVGGAGGATKPEPEGIARGKARKKAIVLLADDEPAIAKAVARALRAPNREFKSASSGAEALDVFRAGGIDLIVSDLRMASMRDGMELLAEVKRTSPQTKFILMSGNFKPEERKEAGGHGADAVLDKPFDQVELRKIAASLLAGPEIVAPVRSAARVVFVDDDNELVSLLGSAGALLGCEARGTTDPHEALEMCRSGWATMVVSDLHMPDMSGLQLLRELKGRYPQIKVIIQSGGAKDDERRELIDAGAEDVLMKPIDIAGLKAAIAKACGG